MRRLSIILIAFALLAGCEPSSQDQAAEPTEAEVNASASAPRTVTLVHCGVVERQVSREDCDELTAIKQSVRTGVAAFNVPSPMTRGEAKTITLVVDRRPPDEIKIAEASAANDVANVDATLNADANVTDMNAVDMNAVDTNEVTPGPEPGGNASSSAPTPRQIVDPMEGRTEQFEPLVGRLIRADLSGDGFRIRALTEASQEIPPDERRIWRWEVIPDQAGTRWLVLRTVVEGEVGGKHYEIAGTPTTKSVEVQVSWGGRIADWFDAAVSWLNRTKILLLALAGALGAVWTVRRVWRGKNPSNQSADDQESQGDEERGGEP